MAERHDTWSESEQAPDRYGDHGRNETSAIRAEIAETRERMSDTLDEIGSRLNPHVVREQVTQRVKEGIREATIGRVEHMARQAKDRVNETGNSMADTVRENPIPAALVAIGLGWLFINRSSSSSHSYRHADTSLGREAPDYGLAHDSSSGEYSRHEGLGDEARHMAHSTRERASHMADSARERVRDVAGTARERVADAGDAVSCRRRPLRASRPGDEY